MKTLFNAAMTLALGWAGVFLFCFQIAPAADFNSRYVNTSVGRSFEDSLTLHRVRMGLTNLNGVAYMAVISADLFDRPGQQRLVGSDLAIGTLVVSKFGPRVTVAHVYIDTGNTPIRIEQAPGKMLNLKIGTLSVVDSETPDATTLARNQQMVAIGTITNLGSAQLREVEVHVNIPAIEVVR